MCWRYWLWTDKLRIIHLRSRLRDDSLSQKWRPPALKILHRKKKRLKEKKKTWVAINKSFGSSQLCPHTWGANMCRNGHIWTQTQEVTFVGLLILKAVGHWPHAAHRQQRLVGSKKKHNIWLISKLTVYYNCEKWKQQQNVTTIIATQRICLSWRKVHININYQQQIHIEKIETLSENYMHEKIWWLNEANNSDTATCLVLLYRKVREACTGRDSRGV